MMGQAIVSKVRCMQQSMVGKEPDYFSESDIDSLNCLTRIAVEFYYRYLNDLYSADTEIVRYAAESVFACVDTFVSLNSSFTMSATKAGASHWEIVPPASLREHFIETYRSFENETEFLNRCGLLLDLFRLELILSTLAYA